MAVLAPDPGTFCLSGEACKDTAKDRAMESVNRVTISVSLKST